MAHFQITLKLNLEYLKVLFSVLYYFLFISMILRNIKSNIKFCADDTMLFSVVKDPVKSADDLNHDLDIIYQWAHQWKMEFNLDPNKQLKSYFSCKKVNPNHPQLIFNGINVKTWTNKSI